MERGKAETTVIKGPMFSEKTTTLHSKINRAQHAGHRIQAFKPVIDDRWDAISEIQSHNEISYPAFPVANASEIVDDTIPDTTFVAIDEAQFFDEEIVLVVRHLAEERGIEVVIAGLPLDFRGEPFGSMDKLLAMADEIITFFVGRCRRVLYGKVCRVSHSFR